VNIIVLFSWLEAAAVEANGVDAISEFLGDNSTKGIARGICFKDETLSPVGCAKDRGGGTDMF
jgi:hypothetical protein